jgi:NAD(P)-dependent dehydrogenase (short-subunit alcohol dehydrogenase family)
MMPNDKVAVIFGAGGAIGGAGGRAFAHEGAERILTGRLRAPAEAVAEDVVSAGGSAEAAALDNAGRLNARCATVISATRSEELS